MLVLLFVHSRSLVSPSLLLCFLSLSLCCLFASLLSLFFTVLEADPKIGVIDVPFTVITDNSAFFINQMLDYARERDDIKAVVILLDSPGGGVTPSEQLFLRTANLREEKPVVVSAGQLIASGGYMMSMGANLIFAKPSSIVGSIGVRTSLFPSPLPNER